VLNPKFKNFPLNNLAISPKETLVGATWVTAFGQKLPFVSAFKKAVFGTNQSLRLERSGRLSASLAAEI